jgi:hypothetical protein
MADTLTIPKYVDYGARATAPGPFTCAGGEFQALTVQGDEDLIDAFVERVYNAPAPEGVAYRRLACDLLIMMTGNFAKVSAKTAPFSNMGAIREVQLSFWLPLAGGTMHGDHFEADRIVMAVPYIFVDNPMSYAGGREDYGYPKVMGQFSPSDGLGDTVTVNAYGGDFNADSMAGWYPFLSISPRAESPFGPDANPPARRTPVSSFEEFVSQASGGRLQSGKTIPIAGGGEVSADSLFLNPRQLFLKQFRDFASSTAACLQQVVEVPLELTVLPSLRLAPAAQDLTVHHLDSHPIDTELGIKSQHGLLPWSLSLSFNVLPGREPSPHPGG